jgi:outer membrane receptor for ferric coprogen and ferric-rhodotorulic acid
VQEFGSGNNKFKVKTLTFMVALALPALAQSQQANSEEVLPEIEVTVQTLGESTEGTGSYTTGRTRTATPLSTSLRDTPQSVTVVTQQRIEDQNLTNITETLNNVTGVYVNQYEANRAQFTARGFDINTLMIDGVPTNWEHAWSSGEMATSLAIYDRVEVVRGSTGLTTGAGDPSAAINLVRKRATSKEFAGEVELGVGSWNEGRVLVDVSTPVNEAKTVRARVVGEYVERDSWADLEENTNKTVFATMEADLTPDTLLSAGVSRQENETRGGMWGGLPVWYSDGTRTDWDRSKTTAADWNRWDTNYENYFAAIEHRFGNDWRAKATYSHGDRDGFQHTLFLYGSPDRETGEGLQTYITSYKSRTRQEDIALQASGPFEFLDRTHELAVGYIYSKQEFNADYDGFKFPPLGTEDNFNTWDGSIPDPGVGPFTFYGKSNTEQQAFYGAARLRVADPLQLILGARLTEYEKSKEELFTVPYNVKHDNEVTPYAGLIYDLNENYSVYGSYTEIFQPQKERDMSGRHLDPILGKSTEVGAKGEFFDGRLNASVALFRIKQDNLAQEINAFVQGTVNETAYREADGATSKGFEVELAGEISPTWNISAGYTKFNAKDAEGNDINPLYPRQLLRLFTTYRMPGTWNQLTVGGGVNWQDKTYFEAENPLGENERVEQDAYALVNLMARYKFSKQLSAQLNLNNIFDEKYYGSKFDQIYFGAPRNATLTVDYKF